MARIYVPANAAMLRTLADTGELKPVSAVHTVTSWLRREAPGADEEDLEYTAFDDAAFASLALLPGSEPRRVVVSADVPDERVTAHAEGTGADFDGDVKLKRVAAVHMDDADAAAVIAAAGTADELAAVEEHVLDWYAPSELQELLAALGVLGSRNP
ncbi:MAG: hypothetical protein HOQ43_08075 [Glycomyces artemisiae]|uniref:Uncharacterized protein n=1 Tax=Glycomyces artemisiae TaxID=1076443 RepID=A0A2T0ULP1_9ACTN|nr:hypothetical protein [Glycomyces artemisiae]NUQ88404.1 hypothetical protein [Glycomyces artemisiae]PRY58855.1 hypothetical protein B0I28_10410 [Glycomyces artemisiae]